MRVVLTGAGGRIGAVATAGFLAAGHELVAVDSSPDSLAALDMHAGIETHSIDVGDPDRLAPLCVGADALVHLAGQPRPNPTDPVSCFGGNVIATFAAHLAAARAGVPRVVSASSASALGRAWAAVPEDPVYLPVDEQHPLRPADHYALSKQTAEYIAAEATREHGLSTIAVRFPWVGDDLTLPGRAADAQRDPLAGVWFRDLWSYLHVEDLVEGLIRACVVPHAGAGVVTLVAPDTLLEEPTAEVLARYLPDVPVRVPIPGRTPAWSRAAGQRILDYQPGRTWRETTEGDNT